ncbi:hypothetical protein K7X08_001533 [Anisodus acutangulus]|uniref:Protein N-terminal glutamine amidohydrolase n=1 Tax=Anisodus acutangulus TaxID=402998 RepID=A0A9Q1RP75_9SOLA|nr:hypothetical protein K7X08_001533 [Anisodus acutangulus]
MIFQLFWNHGNATTPHKLGGRHREVTSLSNANEATFGGLRHQYSSSISSSLGHTNAATPLMLGARHNTVTSLSDTNEAIFSGSKHDDSHIPILLAHTNVIVPEGPLINPEATSPKLGKRHNPIIITSLPNTNEAANSGESGLSSSLISSSSTQTDTTTHLHQPSTGTDRTITHKIKGHFSSSQMWQPLQFEIPLWHQKASQRAEGVILWDYHVICVQKKRNENSSFLVWDFDSSLPSPSPLGSYVAESIRPSIQIFSQFTRRHMKDSAGNWIAQPPSHEAIVAEDAAVHNLNEYNTVSPEDIMKNVEADTVIVVFSEKLGVVAGENDLLGFFSLIS